MTASEVLVVAKQNKNGVTASTLEMSFGGAWREPMEHLIGLGLVRRSYVQGVLPRFEAVERWWVLRRAH